MAYAERVNLAIDHVVGHLGEPLRLADVARAARLSPFHFHRVLQVLVGETLAEFVKRLRLERALVMMAHAPRFSLTTIALTYGFSSSSDFSRCFKQRYGTAPSAFDIKGWREAHGSELQATVPERADRIHLRGLPATHNPDGFRVRIRDLPARVVAYIRVLNPYRGDAVAKATRASSSGRSETQWPTASGSGTNGTTPRSRRSQIASITLPSKPSDSSLRERSAGSDFRR
jgi:AraC family transcriptional regulator